MKVDTDELIAAVDIAKLLGVVQSAVHNWSDRLDNFPDPVCRVANGRTALWLRADILRWHKQRLGPAEIERELDRARALIELLTEEETNQ